VHPNALWLCHHVIVITVHPNVTWLCGTVISSLFSCSVLWLGEGLSMLLPDMFVLGYPLRSSVLTIHVYFVSI